MKIAYVMPNTLRERNAGVEQAIFFLSKYMLEKGHEVELFCTAKYPQLNAEFEGLKLREFSRVAPNEAYYFSLPLFSALKKTDADIIHAYGYNNLLTALAVLAVPKEKPLFITGASSVTKSYFRKWLHVPLNAFYSLLSARITKLICVSEWEKDYFASRISLPSEKWVTIPNGIDVKGLQKIKRKTISHHILSVGRLVKHKGMHRLIAALPRVVKEFPDAHLDIVGDGEERENLHAQARQLGMESHITFHGHIDFSAREKLIELYSHAHVFSLMADSESQGLVYGMALVLGVPVLTPNQSAMKELVREGCALGIEHPDDAEETAQGIIRLFREPFSTQGWERVIWSWEKVGEAVLKEYTHALSTNVARPGTPFKKTGGLKE